MQAAACQALQVGGQAGGGGGRGEGVQEDRAAEVRRCRAQDRRQRSQRGKGEAMQDC